MQKHSTQQDRDLAFTDEGLDRIAHYFALQFEYEAEPTTVLIGLLRRLQTCDDLDRENAIDVLVNKLFYRSTLGEEAAVSFAQTAGLKAAEILRDGPPFGTWRDQLLEQLQEVAQ